MADQPQIAPLYEGQVAKYDAAEPIEGVVIHPVKENVDDRQSLTVYLKATDPFFSGFSQSYVAIADRGVVKAWHYHLRQKDIWYLPEGKIRVGLFDAREGSPTHGVTNSVVMGGGNSVTLVIPPGVYHGYVTLSEKSILINTTDQPYDPQDEYRLAWDDVNIAYDWGVSNR